VQPGHVAVVAVRLGVLEALDAGVGDQHDRHAAVVAQGVEPGQELAPGRQGEDVALAVADVFDVLDGALAADLGPDQPLQPVERVEYNSLENPSSLTEMAAVVIHHS
jgi:hypothetical protein